MVPQEKIEDKRRIKKESQQKLIEENIRKRFSPSGGHLEVFRYDITQKRDYRMDRLDSKRTVGYGRSAFVEGTYKEEEMVKKKKTSDLNKRSMWGG